MPTRDIDLLVDSVVAKGHIAKADIEDAIIEFLNEAYRECGKKDLECFEKTGTLTLLNGTSEYTITTDIATDIRVMCDPIWSTEGLIKLCPPNRARRVWSVIVSQDGYYDQQQYSAVAWSWGGKLYVYPTPDQTYDVYVDYYCTPARVSATPGTFLIPEDQEYLLINFAMSAFAARERDWETVDRLRIEFRAALREWVIAENKGKYAKSRKVVETHASYEETFDGGDAI